MRRNSLLADPVWVFGVLSGILIGVMITRLYMAGVYGC